MDDTRVTDITGDGRATSGEPRYETLDSSERQRAVLEANGGAGRVGCHVATEGGRDGIGARLLGVALCFEPGTAYYLPVEDAGSGELPAELRRLLGRDGPPKAAHDAKPQLKALRQHGADLAPLGFDTALAAFLLGEKSIALEDLAPTRLGLDLAGGEGAREACARADAVLRLSALLEAELLERGQLPYLLELELPLVPVLAEMELAGIRVDTGALERLSRELDARLRELETEMRELAGYDLNPRSPRQLRKLLYEELGLEGGRKTSSGYSTDAQTLEALEGEHPIVPLILEHRQLSKVKETYADALPRLADRRTGRVHTHFSQTVASTGRLSSSDPNLQNIPVRTPLGRQVRGAFVADARRGPSVLLSADYSQIELRVLAHVTGEPRLVEAFARGEDVHALTAADLYGVPPAGVTSEMRRVGKAVNYGVMYGLTGYRLARDTGIERKEAARFVKRHAELYPAIRAYSVGVLREAEERGYVETPLGRRRYLPELRSPSRPRREAARRAAENMPNQGMTADIIKEAMISVHARLLERGMRSRMLVQVHDELLLEAPEGELADAAALVVREMEAAVELSVPLEAAAKYGPTWGDMRPVAPRA